MEYLWIVMPEAFPPTYIILLRQENIQKGYRSSNVKLLLTHCITYKAHSLWNGIDGYEDVFPVSKVKILEMANSAIGVFAFRKYSITFYFSFYTVSAIFVL